MQLLKYAKIALLIVILAEEIRNARKNSVLSTLYKKLTVYDINDKPIVVVDKTQTPITVDEKYKVSLTPN
ncbi:hypothetical protein [Staphylococcus chromogenes]|uniref:hypothetical protein n=1 Tax=Staphylococcus chromogenes TaxID=46126 RepID=UPI000D198852|nr:hypothetical protein [Staphylococcus chromogenes]PTF91618.1 hypothetical protein BU661_06295 [Staphylococcus chromogenes]PTG53522.1 hypothetical protein BU687_05090 [Staphylococcus chromogenes]RIM04498.1 hypothetical protein BU683_05325 [Staphylococcus chromogenes]RIM21414.1 hypothetical protein BU660_03775 [Staphylococcus chromogenes]